MDALARLLPAMLPQIDLPRALLRGRFMAAAAAMEWNGVPIDVDTLGALRTNWDRLKGWLAREFNPDYGVFVPSGTRARRLRRQGPTVCFVRLDQRLDQSLDGRLTRAVFPVNSRPLARRMLTAPRRPTDSP